MGAHTPGPWMLETVPTAIGSCHKIGSFPGSHLHPSNHACIYADGIRVGIDEQLPRAQELLANAKLMAAAPDLLEALRPFANYACDEPCECNNCKARAAIAKATA